MSFFKGIAGFFLYLGSLAVPVEERNLELRILSADGENIFVRSIFEFQWSDKSTEIVNSAIPITIKYTNRAGGEKQELYKTLRKPISQNEYFVIDSAKNIRVEKTYPNIQLALRYFKQIEWEIPTNSERIDLTAEIENSFLPTMNLYVDISPIFGGNRFVKKISVKKEKKNR
jgi:hypothetical protein